MFERKKLLTLATACALAMTATACDDDPIAVEEEPEIAVLRLTVTPTGGTAQTVNITKAGCAQSAPIALTLNNTATVSASFLNAAGQPDEIANDPDDFRLAGDADVANGPELAPTPTTIVWTRTGAFAGTLRGSAATTTGSVKVSGFHIEEGHADFGCTATITVQ